MAFDREKFQKLLHDAGGSFATQEQAEKVIKDCGGVVKGIGPRVIQRDGGHVSRMGKCVEMITAVEPELVLDERHIKQQVERSAHSKQAVTRNGPHEYIEYVPIGEKPVEGTKHQRNNKKG